MEPIEIERQVFRKLLSDPVALNGYISKISPEDFTSQSFKFVISCFAKDPSLISQYTPSKTFFNILLRSSITSKSELDKVSSALASLAKSKQNTKDLDVLVKELKANRMCREMANIIRKNSINIRPENIEDVYEQLIKDLLALPLKGSSGNLVAKIKEAHENLDDRVKMYLQEKRAKVPACIKAFDIVMGGFAFGEFVVISAGTGQGKCWALGTKLMKYSGEIVNVEDVKVGDQMMGPDGKPRTVLGTTRGTGEMYRITPNNGEPWECNGDHMLTLVNTVTGRIIDISVNEYLNKKRKFKHLYKQFFVGVDFPNPQKLLVDPYFLGILYGNGVTNCNSIKIKKFDSEIIDYLNVYTKESGLDLVEYKNPSNGKSYYKIICITENNPIFSKIKEIFANPNRIPHEYLTSSREDRAKLLAGFLDISGTPSFSGYGVVRKDISIVKGICFLSRSLGLRANVSLKRPHRLSDNTYYKINISGDCSILPSKVKRKAIFPRQQAKDITRTGFNIESIGIGEYAGFSLDGDGRLLMEDFTVTHNSNIMLWWAEQMVERNFNVLYITIEMSYEETLNRYHAIQSGFPVIDIAQKRISKDALPLYFQKLIAANKERECRNAFLTECASLRPDVNPDIYLSIAKKYPNRKAKMFFMDIESCNPSRIDQEIQRIAMDTKLDCVFVDFINVMDPDFANKDRVRELASISRSLKIVARKHNVVMFSAAQLNTVGLTGEDKITTDNIKYAKSISENADWLFAFHRTEEDMAMKQVRIQLAKHRHSSSCTALLEFDFATMQAIDMGFAKGSYVPDGYSATGVKLFEDAQPEYLSEASQNNQITFNDEPIYKETLIGENESINSIPAEESREDLDSIKENVDNEESKMINNIRNIFGDNIVSIKKLTKEASNEMDNKLKEVCEDVIDE